MFTDQNTNPKLKYRNTYIQKAIYVQENVENILENLCVLNDTRAFIQATTGVI